jgi:iron complex outermembrane receptor protein
MKNKRNAFSSIKFGTAISLVLVTQSVAYAQSRGSLGEGSASASTLDSAAPDQDAAPGEIVVTAQKRSESINKVGMSISAVSGDRLDKLGVSDISQLIKVVPGFNYTATGYATPVYTIRGVGFQDNTLSASPTVSVYVDEVPVPFSAETLGADLDLERVEVLKGPQGTLYGQNSTGGAINFIAAKPTKEFQAGLDASYSRFNTVDLKGFVSGPLTDTLGIRVAVRSLQSGDWQKSITRADTNGQQNQLYGRVLLDWQPTDRLTFSVNANGWRDRSDTQAFQLTGVIPGSRANPMLPAVINAPLAPNDARAADWDPGLTQRRNNWFAEGSVRIDYQLNDEMKFSSISSYQRFSRDQPFDSDGMAPMNFRVTQFGKVETYYQELRLTGDIGRNFNYIVGANYESDKVHEVYILNDSEASTRIAFGRPFRESGVQTYQHAETKGIYGNAEYKITPSLALQGGLRYTKADRYFSGCAYDVGNGDAAALANTLSSTYRGGAPSPGIQPGQCYTLNAVTFLPGNVEGRLDEHNVSWRAGVNWTATRGALLYANISRGYKGGSFPMLAGTFSTQYNPVKQESILAYEAGFKLTLLNRTLQLNGAGFYYDYSNKQIRGKLIDPVFSAIGALVTVPKSRIYGFELSGIWTGINGLTVSPSVSMVNSRIGGDFYNYSLIGTYGRITGEPFPYTPRWSGNVDAEYTRDIRNDLRAFFGGNLSFQSRTNGGFGELQPFIIKAYQVLDLRAGVETVDGKWRASLFGHNVTNTYYWTSENHLQDANSRLAGMPATYGVSLSFRYK